MVRVQIPFLDYAPVLFTSALTGLGGAVLTVAQLHIFDEGITAGRGWIAVALVIFARWKPGLALVGALLFGVTGFSLLAIIGPTQKTSVRSTTES